MAFPKIGLFIVQLCDIKINNFLISFTGVILIPTEVYANCCMLLSNTQHLHILM